MSSKIITNLRSELDNNLLNDMSEEIRSLKPTEVWEHFYGLTQVPRPSKKEAKATQFAREFGEKLGLETIVDEVGNVIIRKPATPGFENRAGVVLQGHLDMVPQKNSDVTHDFEKDPIDAYIDGEVVRARGTTLGADNGMGVAAAMGVLASKSLKHGPIEALFTIDEETGMTGANYLKPGSLKGRILLNLDSETEGELYVGCAGGLDGSFEVPVAYEPLTDDRTQLRIEVKGLKGGHSGMDIILGRANAIKLMVRIINHLAKYDPRIVMLEGGSLRNAIPRETFAEVAVPTSLVKEFEKDFNEVSASIKSEFSDADGAISIVCAPAKSKGQQMLSAESTQRAVRSLFVLPNGVIRMSDAMPGLVETSSNLARVVLEGEKVTFLCLLRSSVESAKLSLSEKMGACVELAGGKATFDNGYPGWQPNMQSPILKEMQAVYKKEFGKEPKVMAIHAGLECGILGGPYPDMDMISFGPTIMSPHSPDERVNIESVGKFWKYLVHVLENVPLAK